MYSSVVLNEESRRQLLSYVSDKIGGIPENWKKLGDHMTIAFNQEMPSSLKKHVGAEVILTVTHIGISDDAIAVKVVGCKSLNEIPHITIAIPENGKAKNSNFISDWYLVYCWGFDEGKECIVVGRIREETYGNMNTSRKLNQLKRIMEH